ncbi:hypothetical protein BDP27DRAFT_1311012 [Rhodocollybia butyracea]|uniref:Uncharacterized protein n=1 Tax=Rhodocollybia butyracea TaxID=206335 RepID=A0A9P5UGC0_9AGAR|nr:hypothetical protein BDP27DRAFT_1311012 [Rhodocollybia butyracea]
MIVERPLPVTILRGITPHPDIGNGVLNHARLTSKRIYAIHSDSLVWREIYLPDCKLALQFIRLLLRKPHQARLVQKLVLRPNYFRIATEKRLEDERELARAVELLAPHIPNLEMFVWDGIEIPFSAMWASLRLGCPLLKKIGVNLGVEPLDPDSELFAFSDLTSFSLTSEIHYKCLPIGLDEKLPDSFWTMLERSPYLESLVIGEYGPTMRGGRYLDVSPIVHARWPDLHTLTLSYTNLGGSDAHRILFRAFLDAHHAGLRHLSCNKGDTSSVLEDFMQKREANLLPLLRYQRCTYLDEIHHQAPLQELVLTNRPLTGMHVGMFKQWQQELKGLKKLEIWFDFSSDVQKRREPHQVQYDQLKELRDVFAGSHRSLESFKLLVSTKWNETFRWDDLPLIIRHQETCPCSHRPLKYLEVWKVQKRREKMHDVPIQIALDEDINEASSLAPCKGPIRFSAPALKTVSLVACLAPWTTSHVGYKSGFWARVRAQRPVIGVDWTYNIQRWTDSDEPDLSRLNTSSLTTNLLPRLLRDKSPVENKSLKTVVTISTKQRRVEFFKRLPPVRENLHLVHGGGDRAIGRQGKKVVVGNGAREWRLFKLDSKVSLPWKKWLRLSSAENRLD